MNNMTCTIKTVCFSIAVLVLAGCGNEGYLTPVEEGNALNVRLTADGSAVRSIVAFRFEDGILKERFDNLETGSDGTLNMYFTDRSGILFFWANAGSVIDGAGFTVGETALETFMEQTATAGMMTSDGITMTASVRLEGTGSEITVRLIRSVARIDLVSYSEDVSVSKVTVRRIYGTGYVNGGIAARESGAVTDAAVDFGDSPFAGGTEELFYLCEQPSGKYEVEVEVNAGGAWRKLKSTLEAIERNTVYSLEVYGNGASMGIAVSGDGWETGEGSSAEQIMKGLIDVESSELPEGVRVSASEDTIFLPYTGCIARMALKAEAGTEVTVRGSIEGVELVQGTRKSLSPLACFDISAAHRYPGKVREYIYLDIKSENTGIGRVVVVAEANPVELAGLIELDQNGECDFRRYVDGVLGTMTLPEGMYVTLDFPEGEKEWARLVWLSENVVRIEGGWRPNDPEADGRIQSVDINVCSYDGKQSDTYTLKRQNWGLPVIDINGTWWCKYNLRGNVKNFMDQITVASDPADGASLAGYLGTCPDEEFVRILGDQYQGGRQDGLKVKSQEGGFVYEGFDPSSGGDFGIIDPEYMAPDGYRIPGYQDYRFFTWNENANLGYGSNAFNNLLGQRLSFNITSRNAVIDGKDYGPVHIYDFVYEGTHWVMAGLGHQYNASDISPMSVIFATHGAGGRSWMIEGYQESGDGRGNWYKYAAQNAQKTRIIRCIKTPVDYIY